MSRSSDDDDEPLFPVFMSALLVVACVVVVLLFIVLMLTVGKSRGDEVDRETRTYAVVGIDPPKHFKVDLRDTGTGEVQRGLSVSKHCNRWKELTIGTEVQLERVRMQPRNSEPYYYKIIVSPSKLCPGYDG